MEATCSTETSVDFVTTAGRTSNPTSITLSGTCLILVGAHTWGGGLRKWHWGEYLSVGEADETGGELGTYGWN
jgi:hypothetical protein